MDRPLEFGWFLPTWGDKWNKKWGAGPEVFTPANARAYGEWLGRRYAGQAIVWIVGGDRPIETDTHKAIIRAMAQGLRNAASFREVDRTSERLASGEAMTTASTLSEAISAWASVNTAAPLAAAFARPSSASQTAARCAPAVSSRNRRACSAPITPVPITPTARLISHQAILAQPTTAGWFPPASGCEVRRGS